MVFLLQESDLAKAAKRGKRFKFSLRGKSEMSVVWDAQMELKDDSYSHRPAIECRTRIHRGVPGRRNVFVSIAFAASSFLSICGSGLGPPECSKHSLPASTPHVGQGIASKSSGGRSEVPIEIGYGGTCHKKCIRENSAQDCVIENSVRG